MNDGAHSIMVVDDDADIRDAVELVLDAEGYEFVGAADGEAALASLRSSAPPTLILLDLMMPRMNGFELLLALAADPALGRIPVVILSGDTTARSTAAAMGARDCLAKPVDLDVLLGTVKRLVAAPDSASR